MIDAVCVCCGLSLHACKDSTHTHTHTHVLSMGTINHLMQCVCVVCCL